MRPVGAVVVVALALLSCRRESGTLLQQHALFPDTVQAVLVAAPSPPLRAELVVEFEPNDDPARAQSVPALAVVEGVLLAPPVLAGAPARKGKVPAAQDQDWYRMPAVPPGHVVQFDLRAAPACAELTLYDDTGQTVVRRARAWRGSRPVLTGIGPGARASLIRISCAGKAAANGGAYRLAVSTRPATADEEVEPNDTPAPELAVLPMGSVRQCTLAPIGDVDYVPLDLTQVPPGEALVLSVAGVPDLELQVELLDAATLEPILRRRSARGGPVLVPNLDAGRTGTQPWLVVRALAGQAPDAPYAVTVSPWLPTGCASQVACADRLPVEREPNDAQPQAFALTATGASGLIDSPGDVDWFRWQPAAPGQDSAVPGQYPAMFGQEAAVPAAPAVASVRLQAPPGVALLLQVGVGNSAWTLPVPAGTVALLGGLAADPATGLLLAVRGAGTAASQAEAYRLDVATLPGAGFELEQGDEARSPALWTPQHLLDIGESGSGRRSGALLPAGDHDAFGLDLRNRHEPTGWRLACLGDRQPGLTCVIVDIRGIELLRLATGPGPQPSEAPLVLAPGRYKVLVTADRARPSLQPYAVSLQEDPLALALPGADTPTSLAEPATAP